MSNNVSLHSDTQEAFVERPRAFDTIVFGGLIVGVLDALDAMIFFGSRGSKPGSIFQFIASGLIGRSAFSLGSKTVVMGVLLHFLNAFIFATIFFIASQYLPTLIRRPFIWGPLYGVAIHFVMSFVVTPLSAAPKTRYPIPVMLNGVIGHALLVGLPIALLARRSAKARKSKSPYSPG